MAALTSSIALTESAVSTFQDELRWPRKGATVIVGIIMVILGSLSSLGYGPLAFVKIIGMQFLDFFDFLTNSVMMPIAAFATCILISRVIGVGKIEEEVEADGGSFKRKKSLSFYDPVSLPDFCCDHSAQFRGKCIRLDFHVNGADFGQKIPQSRACRLRERFLIHALTQRRKLCSEKLVKKRTFNGILKQIIENIRREP